MKIIGYLFCLGFLMTGLACTTDNAQTAKEIYQWDKLTLSFEGPELSETGADNPFMNYRLQVTFTQGAHHLVVPGFYAADGNAAETSAESGRIWQVRFRPDREGRWDYLVSFRTGDGIAISDDPDAGEPLPPDGKQGVVQVLPAQEGTWGRLSTTGTRYLQDQQTKAYFLKGGTNSPENFLAYVDFDGTYRAIPEEDREGEAAVEQLHTFEPHLKDWNLGDPAWQDGKGKSIIGALNYIATKGMNVVYFLTMNIEGDGKDVWPYTSPEARDRFDCSKLDQWELVFDHMDQLGLMQHMVLQETENEKLLDQGDTGSERKVYLRELIARFGHHRRLTWNMGEENGPANFSPNGQNTRQQKEMIAYVKRHDPYKNLTVVHSHANPHHRDSLFNLLLGFEPLDGMSVQIPRPSVGHSVSQQWLDASKSAGKPWVVTIDEIGHASQGVHPDALLDNNQDTVRAEVLWGNLMAGGAGVEWYFGYKHAHNDLGCEDWRSRDQVWDFTRYSLEFFHTHLPFTEMENSNALLRQGQGFCFSKTGEIYCIYLPYGGESALDLTGTTGHFQVFWYNPRQGGALQKGSVQRVEAGETVDLGSPPATPGKDWTILIKRDSLSK